MFEILTPYRLLERVSRKINSSTFLASPGIWASVSSTGSLVNISGTQTTLNKLVIGSLTSSAYESHDARVGRITSVESFGVRVKTDTAGFHYSSLANVNVGDECYVVNASGYEGKLASVEENPDAVVSTDGAFEIVARIEQVNATQGWVIYKTISPYTSVIEGSSESPSESASESPSNSPSLSPSASESTSESPSESASESASESPSESASESPSESASESPSESPSLSPSASESPSQSPSESASESASESPSASPSS